MVSVFTFFSNKIIVLFHFKISRKINKDYIKYICHGQILIFYGYIEVNFISILNTKSTISQKVEKAKIGYMFIHRFHNIAHLFGPKTDCGNFLGGGRGLHLHVLDENQPSKNG